MRIFFHFILFLVFIFRGYGQPTLENIPDSLKENAVGIVLQNDEEIKIFNRNKITGKVTKFFAIIKEGECLLNKIFIPYDAFTAVDDIKILISDSNGKKIKSINQSKMLDHLATEYISDERVLYYDASYNKYPYFIRLEYKYTSKQTFDIPFYSSYIKDKISVLKSDFKVINFDKQNIVRINESNWGLPEIDTQNLFINYRWEFRNITPKNLKTIQEGNKKKYIDLNLESFQLDGVEGSFSTWQSFGEWMSELIKGTRELDQKSVNEVKEAVGLETDKRRIAESLYNYLQNNMRYISIQYGIGGYKPISALNVHKNKYGDCKGLSNYMKALLDLYGIESYYALVYAGDSIIALNEKYPENLFNHAIVVVPFEQDTVFLECTVKNNPFGYIGSFTGNRKVFLVDGNNSKIIMSTKYSYKDNRIENEFKIEFKKDSIPHIYLKQSLFGIGTEHFNLNFAKTLPDEKFKNHILEKAFKDIVNLKIVNRIDNSKPVFPSFIYEMEFSSPKKILKAGNRYFLDTNIDQFPADIERSVASYKNNTFKIKTGYIICDNFIIKLNDGCKIEKVPESFNHHSSIGNLSFEIKSQSENTLVIKRSFEIIEGNYDTTIKDEIKDWCDNLTKIRQERIVINCN